MKKILKFVFPTELLSLLIILLISLTPFFWLKGGYVILGHDSGMPISPKEHFLDRLETWTYRYDSGSDQTFALGGFFIHGLEAAISLLPLSLSYQQVLEFVIYLFLIGISIYLFCKGTAGRSSEILSITAAVFYQINHFITQGWFIAERTKFSLYVVLPLLLLLLYKLFFTKISPIKAALLSALLMFVFNGGGFLPLFAAIFLSLSVWSLILLVRSQHFLKDFRRVIVYGLVLGFASLIVQMYWILPYALYVKNNYQAEVAKSGGTEGVINWVISISENASYLNLMKLQGIQEWYVNKEHPYAGEYFTQPILRIVPYFFIFVLLFVVIKLPKSKHRVLLLSCLGTALVSIFFMAGSHPPFGFIYIAMIKYLPGFIAFRTPYYKFAPAFFVNFAVLIGFFWQEFFQRPFFRKTPSIIKSLIPILLLVLYFFPFFSVNFFQYTHDLSTKVKLPQYVLDYAQYSNSPQFQYHRTLLIPGNSPENSVFYYSWGYWSLASVQSLLDRRAYISATYGFSLDRKMSIDLYDALRRNDPVWQQLADHLQIDSILIQDDMVPYLYHGEKISSDSYMKPLLASSRVKMDRNFGPWKLYTFNNQASKLATNYVEVEDKTEQFETTKLLATLFKGNQTVYSDQNIKGQSITKLASVLFPQCQDCLLERKQIFAANPNVIIIPGSSLEGLGGFLRLFENEDEQSPPVASLRELYILQASFFRKGDGEARVPVWKEYQRSLDYYDKEIDRVLADYKQTTQQNSILQSYYNNLFHQFSLLKDLSDVINAQEEAELYLETVQKVRNLLKKMDNKIIYTRTLHDNVFLADVKTKGKYDVFLYVASLNYQQQLLKNDIATLKMNDQTFQVPKKTSENWVKIGTVPLEAGGKKIELKDTSLDNAAYFSKEIKEATQKPQGLELELTVDQPCAILPIGNLTNYRYLLNLELESEQGELEPSIHIVSVDDTAPVLPYWGLKQKIQDNSWKRLEIPFAGQHSKFFNLKLCDVAAKETHKIFIRNLILDRYVEPLVALVNYSSEESTNSAVPQVTFEQHTNTEIRLTNSTQFEGMIRLPVPYSYYWRTADSSVTLDRIDGSLMGVSFDKLSAGKQTQLHYIVQTYYIWGWIIAASGVCASLGIIGFLTFSKYAKNKNH